MHLLTDLAATTVMVAADALASLKAAAEHSHSKP